MKDFLIKIMLFPYRLIVQKLRSIAEHLILKKNKLVKSVIIFCIWCLYNRNSLQTHNFFKIFSIFKTIALFFQAKLLIADEKFIVFMHSRCVSLYLLKINQKIIFFLIQTYINRKCISSRNFS